MLPTLLNPNINRGCVFNYSDKHFSHDVFNNRFGTLDGNGWAVSDYKNRKPIVKKGPSKEPLGILGKPLLKKYIKTLLNDNLLT